MGQVEVTTSEPVIETSRGDCPSQGRIFWRIVTWQWWGLVPLAVLGTAGVATVSGASPFVSIGLALLAGVLQGLAGLAVAWQCARQLASAVLDVGTVLQRVSVGDYDAEVPASQRWLLEPLGESTNRMQGQLRARFAELLESREQLRTVLDSMLEGVIAVDGHHRVMLVNRSACSLFRLQEQAAFGRPLWELIRNPQLQEWITQALEQREVPFGGEIQLVAPVARVLAVRAAGLPGRTGGGDPGAVVVMSDISELRRLESVRQEFVANASHELKTPLASISACVETLLDGGIDDPDSRLHWLKTIHEQADRLDKLVRDLLALTRIESEGMKQEELQAVALDEVASRCRGRHQQHADRKEMEFVMEPADEPLNVLADEESIEQILDNLLDNALKYTNPGGRVVLRWKAEGDWGVIEVEDTGIGIPQTQLARIFERFYRVDRARSRELGGTGLGLSIVKHLVQSLGGSISVTSHLGRGSTFTVRLRRAAETLSLVAG